ncbi:ABC transporter substrate-binding protein [Desulfoplanes sp.]
MRGPITCLLALLLCPLWVCVSLVHASFSTFPSPESARVFIVHSYNPDHVCDAPQSKGIERALTSPTTTDLSIEIRHFYMHTKMVYTSGAAIGLRGKLALLQIQRYRPDLVVTIDDNAFRTVGLPLARDPSQKVVFCGLNNPPEYFDATQDFMQSRNHPGKNVTGIYEKLYLEKSLQVTKEVLPDCTKVAGITDFTPTGQAVARQMTLESDSESLPVSWYLYRVRTFEEYKELIAGFNRDQSLGAIYPAALSLPDRHGNILSAGEIFAWTINHSSIPEIPLNFDFSRMGLFGGAAVRFESMGYAAGLYALEILRGQTPGRLPIVDAPEFAIVFNTARAAMLGIKIPLPILSAADIIYTTIPSLD